MIDQDRLCRDCECLMEALLRVEVERDELKSLVGVLVRRMDDYGAGVKVTDHACATCEPGGEIVRPGFTCGYHRALKVRP
jgi:hypothetical protein